MKLQGNQFENSATCKGVGYKDSEAVDIAVIEINGRYPESGWAVNEVIQEMAYVTSGRGNIEIKGRPVVQFNTGDVISIKPGERFAWKGVMTIIVACSPAFNLKQYKIEENL